MYTNCIEDMGLNYIEYTVNPLDLPIIEQRLNISINLYSYFDDIGQARHFMYISRHKRVCEINLLYFNEHYAFIKTFSRLFAILTHNDGRLFKLEVHNLGSIYNLREPRINLNNSRTA